MFVAYVLQPRLVKIVPQYTTATRLVFVSVSSDPVYRCLCLRLLIVFVSVFVFEFAAEWLVKIGRQYYSIVFVSVFLC